MEEESWMTEFDARELGRHVLLKSCSSMTELGVGVRWYLNCWLSSVEFMRRESLGVIGWAGATCWPGRIGPTARTLPSDSPKRLFLDAFPSVPNQACFSPSAHGAESPKHSPTSE